MAASAYRLHQTYRGTPLPSLPYESPYAPHLQGSGSGSGSVSSHPSEDSQGLQQAANYPTLSQQSPPEPHDICSAMNKLGRDMAAWSLPSSSRPSMLPRGESSKTISSNSRHSRPPLRTHSSSDTKTPAALPADNPFESMSGKEGLESYIESPSLPSWREHEYGHEHGRELYMDDRSSASSQALSSEALTRSDDSSLRSQSAYSEDQRTSPSPRPSEDGTLIRVASPDSWRSLLPDDDPYFVSEEELSSPVRQANRCSFTGSFSADDVASNRSESSPGPASLSGRRQSRAIPAMDYGSSRRYSSASSLASASSSFSLLPPIAMVSEVGDSNSDWPASSWRSCLATSVRSEAEALRTKPTTTGIFFQSESRRPASFSTFEHLQPSSAPRRPHLGETDEVVAPSTDLSVPAVDQAHAAIRSEAGAGNNCLSNELRIGVDSESNFTQSSSSLSPASHRWARTALENSEEREKWPCSRNARPDAHMVEAASADGRLNFRRHSLNPSVMSTLQHHKVADTTATPQNPLVTSTTITSTSSPFPHAASTARGLRAPAFSPLSRSTSSADWTAEEQGKEGCPSAEGNTSMVTTTTVTTTTTVQHVHTHIPPVATTATAGCSAS